jgi:hypothetical protein
VDRKEAHVPLFEDYFAEKRLYGPDYFVIGFGSV